MKLFRIANTSSSWWVFADDVEEAFDISMQDKRARKRENLRVASEKDVPDNYHKGLGFKRVPDHGYHVGLQDLLDSMTAHAHKTMEQVIQERYETKYWGWHAKLPGQGAITQPYPPDFDW